MIDLYSKYPRNRKLLSKEECYILINKAQKGNIKARNEIIEKNIGFLIKLAKGNEDLIQEGVFGLIKAIEKFDLSKGFAFTTYATSWVRSFMQRYWINKHYTVREPVFIHSLRSKYKQLKRHSGDDDDDFYIRLAAKQLKVNPKTLIRAVRGVNYYYVDNAKDEGETIDLPSITEEPEINLINFEKLFRCITERERKVLTMRSERYTLQLVADDIGVSIERVRQLEILA